MVVLCVNACCATTSFSCSTKSFNLNVEMLSLLLFYEEMTWLTLPINGSTVPRVNELVTIDTEHTEWFQDLADAQYRIV